jgi:beta-glucosidase
VRVQVDRHDLACWEERLDRWLVEGGEYTVLVGASSRDIRLHGPVQVQGEPRLLKIDLETTVGELLAQPNSGPVLAALYPPGALESMADSALGMDMAKIAASTPLRVVLDFAGEAADRVALQRVIDEANRGAGFSD